MVSSETSPLLPERSTPPDLESSPRLDASTTNAERESVEATLSIYAVIPVLLLGTEDHFILRRNVLH
jgi:hypothetical protein